MKAKDIENGDTPDGPGFAWRSFPARWIARFSVLRPRCFLRLFRTHRGLRRVRALRPEIARDQQALLAFDHRSSSEFTELAKGLADLESQLSKVAGQAARLNLTLQDQDEDRALSSAFALHKKAVAVAQSSIGLALSQGEQMAQIEGSLLQNRERFSQNRLKYRVLVMAIRAEAARIDPENRAIFHYVASEIDNMERQMSTLIEAAFLRLEDIVREAAAGRTQLQNLQENIRQRAHRSDELLGAALEKLRSDLVPCAEASEYITEILEKARAHTNDLITSLQYQDIVRQQLDHVSLGLGDIAGHLAPAGSGARVDLAYLHQAASVHRAHLGTSRSAIEGAGRQIEEGGAALLQAGGALMTRFAEMEKAATSVFRDSRVGELFKQETENLVEIAGLCESTQQRIGNLLDRIEESVRLFSTDIRRHELDVHLIALNSQIAAARVTGAGALGRLAVEVSHHSVDTVGLTEAMSAQLADALARLRGIRGEDTQLQETIGRDKAGIADGSSIVREKLARLDERLQQSSSEVARDFGEAYRRVCGLLGTLGFPAHIAPTFDPAEAFCDRLLEATARFSLASDLSVEGAGRLAAQHSRYTMREEREAHAAALTHAGKPAGENSTALDNVELF